MPSTIRARSRTRLSTGSPASNRFVSPVAVVSAELRGPAQRLAAVADALVELGVPFREGHHIVGALVARAEAAGLELARRLEDDVTAVDAGRLGGCAGEHVGDEHAARLGEERGQFREVAAGVEMGVGLAELRLDLGHRGSHRGAPGAPPLGAERTMHCHRHRW